jgi:D-alanyl-D-alanine carboxypeptidase
MTAASNGQASIAVRVNGELRPVPTDFPVDAVFPIYSITKTFAAICALRLVESGSLQLTDVARQWLPDVNIPTTITLTHLLRHMSGLSDYGALPEYHAAVRHHPDQPWTRQQFLDAVLPQPLLFAPGDTFSYSNIGYMLLIEILERASGRAFGGLVHDLIVEPLCLPRTSSLEQLEDLAQCVPGFGNEVTSDGHIVDVRGRYHPGWCAPRLVASTTEDVTLVFDALLAGRILHQNTLSDMLAPIPTSHRSDEDIDVAMGVYSDRASPWGRNYHHGGGGPGYNLSATVYPDTPLDRVSIAVFVNGSCGPQAVDVEAALLSSLLAR